MRPKIDWPTLRIKLYTKIEKDAHTYVVNLAGDDTYDNVWLGNIQKLSNEPFYLYYKPRIVEVERKFLGIFKIKGLEIEEFGDSFAFYPINVNNREFYVDSEDFSKVFKAIEAIMREPYLDAHRLPEGYGCFAKLDWQGNDVTNAEFEFIHDSNLKLANVSSVNKTLDIIQKMIEECK